MYKLSPIERRIIIVLRKGVPKTREELIALFRNKGHVSPAVSHLFEIGCIQLLTENFTSQCGNYFSAEGNKLIIKDIYGCERMLRRELMKIFYFFFAAIAILVGIILAVS